MYSILTSRNVAVGKATDNLEDKMKKKINDNNR